MSWARRCSRLAGVRLFAGAALLGALPAGCNYTLSGGGGLPSHIRSVYVPPVENQTTRFGLTELLTQGLLDAARGSLGVQLASEDEADSVIRAAITGYDDRALNFEALENVGAEVFQRRITIRARVEIVDLRRNEVIWSGPSVTGAGEYAPDSETEDVGQQLALENLVRRIVDGAQSQW